MLKLDQSFSHKGQTIAWGRFGEGPALIMLHGTPFSSQVWRRVAPHMATRRTVFLFDFLGYGQSARDGVGDVSLGVQDAIFAALLQEWDLRDPDILAHDFGGATALRAYYLQGMRYRSLTLVDPVAVAPWGSPLVQHVRQHEAAFAGAPDYIHEAILTAYLQGAAFTPLSPATLQTYMEPWLGPVGKSAFYRQIALMDQKYTDEIESMYASMQCPVKLLWGEEDQWIPVTRGHHLAAKLTAGRLTTVPRSGHLMQEDAPEAIVAALFESFG